MICSLGEHKWTVAGTFATAAGVACAVAGYRRYLKNKPPDKWMRVGRVSDLYLYPIKSCRGVKQTEMECTQLGGKNGDLRDRMFVVVDNDGHFVTGREQPMLTQITGKVCDGRLKLSAANVPQSVEVDLNNLQDQPREVKEVRIWTAYAEGVDCGSDVARWLSRYILQQDSGLRLLYHARKDRGKCINPRIEKVIDTNKRDFREKDSGLYSDAVSYLLISESSIAELNARLADEKISHLFFRPNIVISGEKLIPFEEDSWDWIKIGNAVFRPLAPCTRCLFTTVDPESGVKSEKHEPLMTLQKYRYVRDSALRKVCTTPAMGILMGWRSGASIAIGDEVMIPAT